MREQSLNAPTVKRPENSVLGLVFILAIKNQSQISNICDKMLFILEDDVSGHATHFEVEESKSRSITVEELLLHFVKFKNIKSPGTIIDVKDLCICHVTGSGQKRLEKHILSCSSIDVKGVGSQVFKVYGLAGQLEEHRAEMDKLQSFKTLVDSLSSNIDNFIEKHDGHIGTKR